MDAADLKFVDESFETVTSFCTLMYIDEKLHKKTFEEIHRVLKPGGRFYVWDIAVPRKTEGSKEKVLFPCPSTFRGITSRQLMVFGVEKWTSIWNTTLHWLMSPISR